MKTSRVKIARAIADKTLKGGLSKHLSQEVAAYLLSERRVGDLDSIMRDIQTDWAEAGYVEVNAASSYPLSSEVKMDIVAQVQRLYPAARQIIVTETIDPKVIGGVRLNLPNRQLDLTVEAKLNKFKQLTAAGKE